MPLLDFLKGKKGEEVRKKELAQAGLLVASSDELEKRIERRREFFEELTAFQEEDIDGTGKLLKPDKSLLEMSRQLTKIDHLLKEVSVPWGRGGSEPKYGTAMLGWEGLLSKAKNIIRICYREITKKNGEYLDKVDLVHKLKGFLIVEVLKYAQFIEDRSWYDSDVSAKYNLILPMVQSQRSTGIDLNAEADKL